MTHATIPSMRYKESPDIIRTVVTLKQEGRKWEHRFYCSLALNIGMILTLVAIRLMR